MAEGSSILICGASGLVGGHCLRLALADPRFERVVTITRRPLEIDSGGRLKQHVVDFERLASHPEAFRVEKIISALGTTIKKAGSQANFRRVDFDYQLEIARHGREIGARHFLLVSSLGASSDSRIFYTRVKGELEEAVRALGYPGLTIVRPSLLKGDRAEVRPGEKMWKLFAFAIPKKYKPVPASDVAAALLQAAHEDASGERVIESVEIRPLARNYLSPAQ